jgi:hypothetical protein
VTELNGGKPIEKEMSDVEVSVPRVEAGVMSGMFHEKNEHRWWARLTISVCPMCLAKHRIVLNGVGNDVPKLFLTECQRSGRAIEVVPYKN